MNINTFTYFTSTAAAFHALYNTSLNIFEWYWRNINVYHKCVVTHSLSKGVLVVT